MFRLFYKIKASAEATYNNNNTYKWWAVSALGIGTLTTVGQFGQVNVAMPTIAHYFDSDLSMVHWVFTGNVMAISAVLMPMGRLSDIIGRKTVYLCGLLLFVLATGMCALASNLGSLIAFRVIHGISLGMIEGNQLAIMTCIFPSKERGKALGLHMTLVGAALIVGPLLGGILVDSYGWRAVFYINVPLGLMILIPAFLILDEKRMSQAVPKQTSEGFDFLGACLSSCALLLFLIGMSNPLGLAAIYNVFCLLLALIFVSLFVLWETKTASPMLDMSLFRTPLFSLGVGARTISFITAATVFFLMPFYLQGVVGYTPSKTGLIMITLALGMVLMGPIVGPLSDQLGSRRFTVIGATLSAIGLFVLSRISEDTTLVTLILGISLQSIGSGMFTSPNTNSILSSVPRASYGIAAGFVQLLRTSSTVTGIAIATAIITATMVSLGVDSNLKGLAEGINTDARSAFVGGLRNTYLAMACLQLVAVTMSVMKTQVLSEK
ncbi:MFS transporter [SAR202 cluster bacterium AC-409-J13_OGT_754m]|nr:MFS transporter [SAR202 cluster bacterium AC-409-J13_OGT_754m]